MDIGADASAIRTAARCAAAAARHVAISEDGILSVQWIHQRVHWVPELHVPILLAVAPHAQRRAGGAIISR
eukprot:2377166-Pyramimonas_sp.AAC.1